MATGLTIFTFASLPAFPTASYRNRGDGTFEDITRIFGPGDSRKHGLRAFR